MNKRLVSHSPVYKKRYVRSLAIRVRLRDSLVLPIAAKSLAVRMTPLLLVESLIESEGVFCVLNCILSPSLLSVIRMEGGHII